MLTILVICWTLMFRCLLWFVVIGWVPQVNVWVNRSKNSHQLAWCFPLQGWYCEQTERAVLIPLCAYCALLFPLLSSLPYDMEKCLSGQRCDDIGALMLALTFDHVALTFKCRNKYVLENGSSDLSQIRHRSTSIDRWSRGIHVLLLLP